MRKKFNDKQIQEIIALYKQGESSLKIADRFNAGDATVRKWLKLHNVEMRSISEASKVYSINEEFFEAIDTERKAYWLGYMYADGLVSNTKHRAKNDRNYFSKIISLTSKDREVIEQFIDVLDYTGKISEYSVKDRMYYKVYINSDKLFDDLYNLGCVERKSLVLKFPLQEQVPTEFVSHFIRGYFDGDGAITLSSPKKYPNHIKAAISICGTYEFLYEVRESLDFLVDRDKYLHKEKRRETNTWNLRFDSSKVIKFYDYIYQNSTVYLQRKRDKFETYFEQRRSTTIIESPEKDYGIVCSHEKS